MTQTIERVIPSEEKMQGANNIVKYLPAASAAAAATIVTTQPVFAQSDPLQDVQDTLTTVGTIAASAAGIVLVALGVRLGIKQVNRIMTKG